MHCVGGNWGMRLLGYAIYCVELNKVKSTGDSSCDVVKTHLILRLMFYLVV